MNLSTWKGFLKGMFLTTVVLMGSTMLIALSIGAYPSTSNIGKGVLIVACFVALASVYRVGQIWFNATVEYRTESDSEQ